ncbi:MAG: hypothetical protein PWQ81_753 [Bacteroidota bacterium]|jgi:ABC-type xylose transport system substrate-binding protein|nr:hypothetical protein [Bacteroidota bacterium]MDN5306085.1 hypothetical protein [Bacteroidota bacterium]
MKKGKYICRRYSQLITHEKVSLYISFYQEKVGHIRQGRSC